MEMLSGGEMLVRSLHEEGVEYIYGYPGGSLLHVYDAIYQQSAVKHVLVRHEQAAAHMADGYARASGKPGVVMVTSGPGATNTITGIATAFTDSIPMIVISGQVMSHLIGDDAFQETDMMGISRPIVKHSFSVTDPRDIPEIVKKAFYIATSGRPGPVVIDVPKDMTMPNERFEYEYPKKVKIRSYTPPTKGHAGQIRKAVELMVNAKRPIIYSGGGVILGGAHEQLRKLTRELNAPITQTLMGLGAYPATDRQSLGMLGMHGSYEANMAMHHADVILAVGARFDDRVTNSTAKFCPDATIVHIDIDPSSISKTVEVDVPIVGPVDSVLNDMLDILSKMKERPDADALASWWKQIEEWRKRHGGHYDKNDNGLLKPQEAIEGLWEATNGQAYITSDVGQHQMFAAQYYKFDEPNKWINSGGLGTMGFGLPAAMGIKLNYQDDMVVCVTGEGSIQMNIQELSTCLQYGIPVKIFCLNNGYLGMVRQWQDMNYEGRHSSSYMESLPDWTKLVESYGHVGINVETKDQLKGALDDCFNKYKDRLVFVNVAVDPEEHVYPMQVPMGAMRDMWLSKTERT
ncbi:acetolactate synthase 3 large subunit [Bermanella marisrubri]|uniref:Acetolactate synthase n=1 Tax=Bermanella marisrubri TaxID=207949 RepID=Q1MZZ9_9GAMM|nr:acetolactate synthase 3 large subunit [Bermanella marisrubri]EAT11564.1 acetolactate synthase, large subunit, biosynthetic type [Oceanobacter sp. RED65] [Bermanella marisrubri]QIZ85856.1 acetolactate synthase 3 large subunit [Bermanella marisrubri]